ncbi:MAG: hypothetical protein AB7K86_08120 [Rhodospirillales bacterium]
MATLAQASDRHIGDGETASARGFGPMVASLTEYRRAAAAERRYDQLLRSGAVPAAEASRRVFEEFYAS